MKRAYISIGIIIILILSAVINVFILKNISNDIKENLEITTNTYDKESLNTAHKIFKDKHSYLCAVTYHSEIDNLRLSFIRAKTYLELEDYDDYKAETEALISSVEHIKENERFILGNIF